MLKFFGKKKTRCEVMTVGLALGPGFAHSGQTWYTAGRGKKRRFKFGSVFAVTVSTGP